MQQGHRQGRLLVPVVVQCELALGMQAKQQHGAIAAHGPDFRVAQVAAAHLGQQHGQARRSGTNAVHPDPAGQGKEQAGDVRIAAGPPGKTRPEHAPGQLGQQPASCKNKSIYRTVGKAKVLKKCTNSGVVQGQKQRQGQHPGRRQWGRQAAVGVHGGEQPPKGAHQPAGAKQPAQQRPIAPARGGEQGFAQQRQTEQLQPPQGRAVARPGQRGRVQPASGQHRQAPLPRLPGGQLRPRALRQAQGAQDGVLSAVSVAGASGRRTWNQRTAPPLVSSTRSSSPSHCSTWPRRGTWPRVWAT